MREKEITKITLGFPGDSAVKTTPANKRDTRDMGSISGSGRFPWRRAWQPTPVVLPGESHGQGSLAGYRPRSHKELNMTEPPSTLSCPLFKSLPNYLITHRLQWLKYNL